MIAIGLFWFLFAIAAIMPLRWSVILLFSSLPFGSMTVVPGSITILPFVALSPLVVAKVLLSMRNSTALWDGLLNWRRLGLLTAFMAVALVVTYTAPVLFRGVTVMGLNSLQPTPLSFNSGNITQPLYLTMSFLLCVALYQMMLTAEGRSILAVALLTGGTIAVVSGLMDMATAGTSILAPLRTANYAIIEDAQVGNTRRIIGFNTEASAFGGLVVSFAALVAFIGPAGWLNGKGKAYQTALAVALMVMAVLSTSSSAYIGVIAFVALFLLRFALTILTPRSGSDRRTAVYGIIALLAVSLLSGLYLTARPAVINVAMEMVDNTLIQKGDSDSANERGSWNRVSLKGLSGSGGYGVGVGSTRSSSWIVAVLSSTGIFGFMLLLAFILRGFLARLPRTDPVMHHAATGSRFAFLVVLAPAAVAGTLVDFGVFNAFLFALMAAAPKVLAPPRVGTAAHLRLQRRF